ncbi:hypothetical protein MAR_036134 [Mya arenaria]|uniref:Uncharacterized protein n=1 Tax=Mya arenaria TaxID=6604 RepID=A0ABY7EM55_MYAAR|nr:hypothetical protein MAR_036134 [Mya arenaria]
MQNLYCSYPPFVYVEEPEPEMDWRIPGSMHTSFQSVMRGMKFINTAQQRVHAPSSPDEETRIISSMPSILDFKNRQALARQGFYGDQYLLHEKHDLKNEPKSRKTSALSAAEKRKQFVDRVKSKSKNWSFTDEDIEEQSEGRSRQRESVDSWDRGLVLKSFSDRFSSDSSMESNDSMDEKQKLRRQSSISNLRKQYQDTIRHSIDHGDSYPVFTLDEESDPVEPHRGITELRKRQVDDLMLSKIDDGDYVAEPSKIREFRGDSALILAQKSTQSTLVGSPVTPREFNYSFDESLRDGKEEFDFESPPNSSRNKKVKLKNGVSIVIEEDISDENNAIQREVNPQLHITSNHELSAQPMNHRSDSCNTLVAQDSNYENDLVENGDLSSRHGEFTEGQGQDPYQSDALSESSSSLISGGTVIRGYSPRDFDDLSRSSGSYIAEHHRLKPKVPNPPQESFELEEISSADTLDDLGGPMEKSLSTHSDSSGFADLDMPGEITYTDSSRTMPAHSLETAEKHTMLDTSRLLNVTKHLVRSGDSFDDKENINPSLESITYSCKTAANDKAVTFTVDIPLSPQQQPITSADTVSQSQSRRHPRYVSALKLDMELLGDNVSVKSSDSSVRIKPAGPVTFTKLGSSGNNELDIEGTGCENLNERNDHWPTKQDLLLDLSFTQSKDNNVSDFKASPDQSDFVTKQKENIIQRKKSKEALVAAKNQTADWLLNTGHGDLSRNQARNAWGSTPDLKPKMPFSFQNNPRMSRLKHEGQHSFDILLDRNGQPESTLGRSSPLIQQRSVDSEHPISPQKSKPTYQNESFSSLQSSAESTNKKPFLKNLDVSACSSMDESVNSSRPSLIGSSASDTVPKMPNMKFKPNFHLKNWTRLPKQKMLEEETRLMQHAVQRYKTELCIMENMLFSLYSRVQKDLIPEERAEVEELQQLWSQVRKEVIKMEDLLADRLHSVLAGNNSYSPLDALEIIQTMIDLLREQLYHQQMCICRDVSFCEDDDEDELLPISPSVPSTSGSVDGSWMSEISNQMIDLKTSLETSQETQRQELKDRIAELDLNVHGCKL